MSQQYEGRRVLTGTQGKVFWDGMPVLSVSAANADIELDRSDIFVGMDKDTKLNGVGGTVSLTVDHVYSKAADLLAELKAGRDPRVMLSIVISDPDAMGGQQERVNMANCWFTKFPLAGFTKGEHVSHEYELGFRATADSEFAQAIS